MTLTGTPAARAAAAKRDASSSLLERADRHGGAGKIVCAARRADAARSRRPADRTRAPASRPTPRRRRRRPPRRRPTAAPPSRPRRRAARQHRALAGEREEHRQPRQALHARRLRLDRDARCVHVAGSLVRCLARSCAMIRFSSGRQEPQLVPARVACADLARRCRPCRMPRPRGCSPRRRRSRRTPPARSRSSTPTPRSAQAALPSSCMSSAPRSHAQRLVRRPDADQAVDLAVDDGGGAIACAGRDARRAWRRR